METKIINVKTNGGPITVNINADRFPQSVAGNVWRYKADKTKDGKAGIFNSHVHDVQLGGPTDINQKFFLVRVRVIAQNDDPPTPYQVVISVLQNGVVITSEIPEGGSGRLGKDDIVFDYKFQIVAS